MDKNTVIGFILMAAVLIGFSIYNQPSEAEIARQQQLRDSLELVRKQQEEAKQQVKVEAEKKIQAEAKDSTSVLFQAAQGTEQEIMLENELVKITLNTKGGVPTKAELKNYKNQDRVTNIELFTDKDDKFSLAIEGKNENILTEDLFFTPTNVTDSSAVMSLPLGNGHIDFIYKLSADNYILDMEIKAVDVSNYFSPNMNKLSVNLHEKAKQLEKGYSFENRYSSLTYKESNGGTDYLSETSDDEEEIEKPLDWMAFKNQFFSFVLIADQNLEKASLKSKQLEKNSGYLKEYSATANTFFDVAHWFSSATKRSGSGPLHKPHGQYGQSGASYLNGAN